MTHNAAEIAVEAAVGAVVELAKQGGSSLPYHAHGAGQLGQWAVQGATVVAPALVAKGAAVAAAVTAGPVLLIAAGVGVAGFAVYKFCRWISEE